METVVHWSTYTCPINNCNYWRRTVCLTYWDHVKALQRKCAINHKQITKISQNCSVVPQGGLFIKSKGLHSIVLGITCYMFYFSILNHHSLHMWPHNRYDSDIPCSSSHLSSSTKCFEVNKHIGLRSGEIRAFQYSMTNVSDKVDLEHLSMTVIKTMNNKKTLKTASRYYQLIRDSWQHLK